ncbi:MAG: DUF4238 domain-containing protein [Bacteroidetes bacterium]|nr:DUF4238 domain-containing protein [Bacteroidota bacterium]
MNIKKNSNPKKQHYISDFYLKYFADTNSKIHIYDREKNEYRYQLTEKVAKIDNYYTLYKANGEKDFTVDNIIGDLETQAKPIFERILKRKLINKESKKILAQFISLFKNRTPEFEKFLEDFDDKANRELEWRMPEIKDGRKPLEILFGYSGNTRETTMYVMLRMLEKMPYHLLNKDWSILLSNNEETFITSDNPFILIPNETHINSRYGYGIETPGVIKCISLSSKHCLTIWDEGTIFRYGEIGGKNIEEINCNIAINCNRFLFCNNKATLEKIVVMTGINEYQKGPRVV